MKYYKHIIVFLITFILGILIYQTRYTTIESEMIDSNGYILTSDTSLTQTQINELLAIDGIDHVDTNYHIVLNTDDITISIYDKDNHLIKQTSSIYYEDHYDIVSDTSFIIQSYYSYQNIQHNNEPISGTYIDANFENIFDYEINDEILQLSGNLNNNIDHIEFNIDGTLLSREYSLYDDSYNTICIYMPTSYIENIFNQYNIQNNNNEYYLDIENGQEINVYKAIQSLDSSYQLTMMNGGTLTYQQENIIEITLYGLIIGIFVCMFTRLFINVEYYQYFIPIIIILSMLFYYLDIPIRFIYIAVFLYIIYASKDEFYKTLFISILTLSLIEVSHGMATTTTTILVNYNSLFVYGSSYYYPCIYLIDALILLVDYFIFHFMDEDYRKASYKDLFWFFMVCLLVNVFEMMIVNYTDTVSLISNMYGLPLVLFVEIILILFVILTRSLKKTRAELIEQEVKNYTSSLSSAVMKNIEESYKGNRQLRHDLNNHLLAIELRIKHGNQQNALDYIHQISSKVSQAKVIQTDNDTLNYLINSKITLHNDIDFSYRIETS
ncbi:MAG: hypothetical protein LUH02_00415, partial [Erysipelotrichaceae bacterium]|nr:hypothetical protein [Erysipelotrichaceae bacterium]